MEAATPEGRGGGGGGMAFFVQEGGAMETATELLRNPPLAASHTVRGGIQATLAVLINGTTPCDCIYISQSAVDTHHVHPSPSHSS
jgi:hypothetical protein